MRIALFIHGSHRFLPDVVRLAERAGQVFVMDCDDGGCENLAADYRPELVLNFLTREVFKRFVLDTPNVNFHPGTPAYPGVGSTSRALFDGVETFGATAHRMVRKIDAGEIYAVEEIPVRQSDTSETLFARTEAACVALLDRITDHVARHGALPAASEHHWTGDYVSAKQFFAWMELDPADKATFDRKLRATRHSKKHGPYITVHGHRFVLAKS